MKMLNPRSGERRRVKSEGRRASNEACGQRLADRRGRAVVCALAGESASLGQPDSGFLAHSVGPAWPLSPSQAGAAPPAAARAQPARRGVPRVRGEGGVAVLSVFLFFFCF